MTAQGDPRTSAQADRKHPWPTAAIAAVYVVLAVAMTWPLAPGIAGDVPGDLGDPLLVMWILGWGAEQLPRMLSGQATLTDYWNANIFHPEPLVLGFSEHLFAGVLQVLPVYWLTGNLILAYNLLFLSSFALSGFGMFLLVRDLLGDRVGDAGPGAVRSVALAAFIAGLIFAFVPYRLVQISHLQSLQTQWMPLALFGFRRYVVTGRVQALAGGSAALVMQNWSSGYYLMFFAPFAAAFVVHQMWAEKRLRARRVWAALAAATLAVIAATLPFLTMYLATREAHAFERPAGEVIGFSADVYSYLTAPAGLRVWGDVLRPYPKPEGELFFGLVPWVLFVVAVAWLCIPGVVSALRDSRRRIVVGGLIGFIGVQSIALIAIAFTGGFVTSVAGIQVRASNPAPIVAGVVVAGVALFALAPSLRPGCRDAARSPVFVSAVLTIVALWLSLGPVPQTFGQPLQIPGLYNVFTEWVPGFDSLRVPARYAMIAVLFLSVTAGFGAARMFGRTHWSVGVVLGLAFLVEAAFVPMTVNATWNESGVPPPARVEAAADAPAVYHTLAALPDGTVVAEFPFGDPEWELRYVYYSTVHWKRLLNGYSGGFPQGYRARVALLQRVREYPDAAWRALRDAGTTHVVVHGRALPPGEAALITQWLTDHFAVEIARFGDDVLFDVTGVWPPR